MNYTFYISTASSVSYQVYPLNWLECTLVDEKEREQQFYRRKFEGALTFGGKKLCTDFDLFYTFEQSDPCQTLYLFIFKDGDSYWEGYFSTSMGKWDLDNKTFSVTPKVIDDYTDWDNYGKDEVNFLAEVVTEVTTNSASVTYDSNRWLTDVIEAIGNHVFGTVNLSSLFFTSSTNYVTGLANKYTLLTIAQKSDIKRPTASNEATVANLSFEELMYILRVMFNVYWTWDGYNLTVEHISYFTKTDGIDLRTQEIASRSNRYEYDKEEMPRSEKFSWMEAFNKDFIGVPIKYETSTGVASPCVENTEREYSIRVTTDIEMIENDTDSVADDGFVILANYLSGASYYIYRTQGIYALETRYNNDLSWGNLHHNFHRHGRVLEYGYLNNDYTAFSSTIRTKKQEINAIICNPHVTADYDPNDLITTELGETYFAGEKGEVKSASIHPYEEVNFTLLYGETNISGEITPLAKVLDLAEDIILHNNSYLRIWLSEPAEYDMYLWVWIDEMNCQEFIIPEGNSFYEELLNFDIGMEPLDWSMLKYNLDHSSLTGWDINLHHTADMLTDDTADLVRIDDTDCGDAGTTPPPPVAPTVTLSVKAGETWTIDNDSGSIGIGSATLSITFMPHDCTLPGSHLVYIKVTRNTILDVYSSVYAKELWQANKNITVTAAASGDVYEVELSEESYT